MNNRPPGTSASWRRRSNSERLPAGRSRLEPTSAAESWAINEHSNVTADGPPIYPFKTVIPIAGAILLLQGIVEIIRCVICIRQGYWPSREQDVEEVDVDKLKEMVHVKDEDIQKLDRYVVRESNK